MDEPSQLARAHTRLLRQSVEPPAGTREQNWAQLGSALEFAEAAAETTPWVSVHAIKVFALTVGIGTLGLVGVDLVVQPRAEPPVAPAIEHPAHAATDPQAPTPANPPAPANPPEAVPPPPPDAPAPAPATAPAPHRAPAQDPLAAELALTDQVKIAYRTGDLQRAAQLAERHRTRFPTGVFAPERDAILAEHACRSGDPQAAARFADRYASSPLARRVAAACGGE